MGRYRVPSVGCKWKPKSQIWIFGCRRFHWMDVLEPCLCLCQQTDRPSPTYSRLVHPWCVRIELIWGAGDSKENNSHLEQKWTAANYYCRYKIQAVRSNRLHTVRITTLLNEKPGTGTSQTKIFNFPCRAFFSPVTKKNLLQFGSRTNDNNMNFISFPFERLYLKYNFHIFSTAQLDGKKPKKFI